MKKILLIVLSFILLPISVFSTDFYWSGGSSSSDNIDLGDNWYNSGSHPSSGDNLYFNNTSNRHWVYSNYGSGSWFGYIITYNGAGGIKLYGDNTYAYKFENNNDANLFEISPSNSSAGSREIGNRLNSDLEINPVGSGGILVSCDKISMDNTNGVRSLKVYGSNTLTINGIIYEKNGSGATLQLLETATVELKGNSTFTGLTSINGGLLKLNASGGALNSGNAVSISGGTLEIAQSQTLGNFTMTSGTLKIDAGQTLTITGTYDVTGGTIDNEGTIILQGSSSQSFPGSSVTINNGTAGTMTNLTINNSNGVLLDKSFAVNTLTINSTSNLTINIGSTISATTFNINSDSNGTGVFLNNGTFAATTSNINQYFNATLSRNWYISSPVTGATVPTGQTYYSYLEDGSNTGFTSPATAYWKANAAGTTLSAGTGYIAQPTATSGTFTFSGTLNTGTVNLSLTRNGAIKPGFNLVGNPFPAYLNIDGLVNNTNLEHTYWYRSYNGAYVFDTYNIPSALSTGSSGFTVSKYIPPMQAFWLRVANGQASVSVSFSSSDCAVQDDSNNKFRAPAAKNTVQKVLRLDVTDGTTTDETILYANPNAADSFDAYDSHKMTNSSDVIPEIYTTVGAEQLAINGMNSIPMDTPIPLGFTTGVSNTFTISAKEFSNFDPGIKVYLVDNQNNTQNDLTASPYTFDASASSDTRFAVVLSSSVATGINTARKNTFTAYSNSNGSIVIQNNLNSNQQVDIFNSTGQKVFSSSLTTNPAIVSPNLQAGIYLIQLTTINNKYIKKITIN